MLLGLAGFDFVVCKKENAQVFEGADIDVELYLTEAISSAFTGTDCCGIGPWQLLCRCSSETLES
jgi:hypothetical protein